MKNLTKIIVVTLFAIGSITSISIRKYIDKHGQPQIRNGALELPERGLTSLEGLDEIPNPQSVINLQLAGNKIHELPAGIFDKFPNLIQINLASNRIDLVAPGVFDKLPNLMILLLFPVALAETQQEFREKYLKNNNRLHVFQYKTSSQEEADSGERKVLQEKYAQLLNLMEQFKQSDVASRAPLLTVMGQKIKEIMKNRHQRFAAPPTDEDGNTPLHLEVLAGNKELVELLAPIPGLATWQNKKGNTPLHLAMTLNTTEDKILEIVQALLPYSAEVLDVKNKPTDLSKPDSGDTPIMLASQKQKVLKYLMVYGARAQRWTSKKRKAGTS